MFNSFLTIAGIALMIQSILLVYLSHDVQLIIFGVMGGFLILIEIDIRRYLTRLENRQ